MNIELTRNWIVLRTSKTDLLYIIANASRCICTYGQSANPRSACLLICCIACWERAISHILGSFRFAIRLLGPFRTGFCGNVFVYYIEKCLLIDTSSLVTWAIVYDLFGDRSVFIPVQRLQYKASQFSCVNESWLSWKKLCWQEPTKLDIPFACAGCTMLMKAKGNRAWSISRNLID